MRVGINVPDELLQRLKQVLPGVKLSHLVQETLKEQAAAAERAAAQVGEHDLGARLDTLAVNTAPPLEPDWEGLAWKDAWIWVEKIAPEGWSQFRHQSDMLRRQGRSEAEMVPEWSSLHGAKGHRSHMQEHAEWFISQYDLELDTGVRTNARERAEQTYARAWLGYVLEVVHQVEARQQEILQRLLAERAAEGRSRPSPEIPPQLLQ